MKLNYSRSPSTRKKVSRPASGITIPPKHTKSSVSITDIFRSIQGIQNLAKPQKKVVKNQSITEHPAAVSATKLHKHKSSYNQLITSANQGTSRNQLLTDNKTTSENPIKKNQLILL